MGMVNLLGQTEISMRVSLRMEREMVKERESTSMVQSIKVNT